MPALADFDETQCCCPTSKMPKTSSTLNYKVENPWAFVSLNIAPKTLIANHTTTVTSILRLLTF